MAKKKTARKKPKVARKKPALKKKRVLKKKSAAKKKPVAKKKAARRKKSRIRGRQQTTFPLAIGISGLDSASGGQSGDTQGLSRREDEDSESVAELAAEGQYFEAEAVSGVEGAKNPDEEEVTTSEVPEDDVPREYTDRE